jgi:hypothetical protein
MPNADAPAALAVELPPRAIAPPLTLSVVTLVPLFASAPEPSAVSKVPLAVAAFPKAVAPVPPAFELKPTELALRLLAFAPLPTASDWLPLDVAALPSAMP